MAIGALIRWFVLSRRPELMAVTGDEAVVGLMAQDLRDRGRISVLFWGQQYGGTIEPLLTGVLFVVAPSTPLTLKLVPMGLALLAWLNISRVAAREITRGAGLALLAIAATWPPVYVQLSTLAYGFYWAFLLLSSCFLALALRLMGDERRWTDWALFGLTGGAMLWTTPLAVTVGLPISVCVLVVRRHDLREIWVVIPAALVGASPWLAHSVGHIGSEGWLGPDITDTSYLERLWVVFTGGVARMTGLDRLIGGPSWVSTTLSLLLLAAALAGARRITRLGSPLGMLVAAVIVALLPLLALFPTSHAVGEARYQLALWPFVLLGLVALLPSLRPLVAPLIALALGVLTALHVHTIDSAVEQPAPDVVRPVDLTWATQELERLDIHHAAGDYWIIYPLAFEADGSLIVSPPVNSRRPAWDAQFAAAPRVAYVIVNESASLPTFLDHVEGLGIPHEVIEGPTMTIVVLDRSAAS